MLRALASVCVVALLSAAVSAAPSGHDSRTMTKAERGLFVPLACEHASYDAKSFGDHCSKLIGYPNAPGDVRDFGLTAIAYGSFTNAGADQAYVSYYTMSEPHAYNFGGGILFQRSGSAWKLVRWYPGAQMEECVAVPGEGLQRMLCLNGFLSEGELATTVSVRTVPLSNDQNAISNAGNVLISLDDTRNMSSFLQSDGTKCGTLASDKSSVVAVDSLKPSAQPGFFAESQATYTTAQEWFAACKSRSWDKIKGRKITVRYALKGSDVTFDSPVPIESASP